MKNLKIILPLLIATLLLGWAAVFADPLYVFELSDARIYKDKTDNWSIDVSVPRISGMADEAAQQKLNEYFLSKADEMILEYERSVAHAKESIAAGNAPNFGYQYTYDVVTDSDDFFVLQTSSYFFSSSVTESSEYWTLDKKTGQLLELSDIVRTSREMADIREQIYLEMLKFNRDAGAPVFRTEDTSLAEALVHVGEKHHWYFNEYRNLIITFDKYELGPAIVGSPVFQINHSTFYYDR